MASLWAPVQANDRNAPAGLSAAIARVVKKNIHAVVHIGATQTQTVPNTLLPFENDPFFRYFFNVPGMSRQFVQEQKGHGTGMIIDSQGHILTNKHVVGGATETQVLLSDGRTYTAKLVGTDFKTDVAVIKISAEESLHHVIFGDSDKMEVGDWVVAIGCPRGLGHAVTQGIISARHRRGITNPGSYRDFLQTDAAINPGNSGGPLLNLHGEVIGVNVAIASQAGGFEGIGFAIPSNMALHVAQVLIAHGKVERGWLGVSVQDLTPELAKSFGLTRPLGALIAHVVKEGPADKAGIRIGDVVTGYMGKEIPDGAALRNRVSTSPIGLTVKVSVFRNRKSQTLTVKIGSSQQATREQAFSVKARLRVDVRPVTSEEVERYGLDSQQGVVVVSVPPESPLARVGFEANDMMLEINGQAIEGLEGFVDLLSALRPEHRITIRALDHRSGRTGYVQVVVP